jgi:hypothetical protein
MSQVGTGDRSEKIKTYNYKDSRCSDHRLKQNYDLNKQLDGEIEDNIQVTHLGGEGRCAVVWFSGRGGESYWSSAQRLPQMRMCFRQSSGSAAAATTG